MQNTEILVLDTETTGMDPELGAEIIEIAFRRGLSDTAESRLWRIRPLRGIPADATRVHGITDEMAQHWPTFGEVAEEIAKWLHWAKVIVGYNPDYDLKMLQAEMKRAQVYVDWSHTIVCAKRMWDLYQPRPPRDLQMAYMEFVDPDGFEGAHGALIDCRVTAQVMRAQLERFGIPDSARWDDLDPERSAWWGPSSHVLWDRGVLMCNFGKYKGQSFIALDPGMLRFIRTKDFPQHVKDLATEANRPANGRTAEQINLDLAAWARRYK